MGDYSGLGVRNVFLDADKPAYPLALTQGIEWEIVRTTAAAGDMVIDQSGHRQIRSVVFTHYVRKP